MYRGRWPFYATLFLLIFGKLDIYTWVGCVSEGGFLRSPLRFLPFYFFNHAFLLLLESREFNFLFFMCYNNMYIYILIVLI